MTEVLEKKEVKEHVVQPLPPANRQIREYAVNSHVVNVENGTGPADLLVPGYWCHHGAKLTARDRIEAWAEDMSWMAEYVVLNAERLFAQVHLLHVHDFASKVEAPEPAAKEYQAEWKGPQRKWCVTGAAGLVKEDFGSKDEALAWIKDRLKAN